MTEMVYLDNASTAFPRPPEVLRRMFDFYEKCGVNPGRTGNDQARQAEEVVRQARQALCALLGGSDENRLVFSHNATDSLNLLISSALRRGDHVVSTRLEHNSVLRPLYRMEKQEGVALDLAPFGPDGLVDPAEIEARLRPETRMVIVIHGSNVIGTIQPIAEIGRICRERGVLFACDCAQTAGVVPIDVQAMKIDVACFTGHKSLLGPTGTGGMYVAEHVDLWPCRAGGTGVRSALREHLPEYPWRMEFGTLNILGIAGLLAGQRWIAAQGGVEAIHAREMALARRLRDGLAAIEGVALYCADLERDHLPVLSCNIQGLAAEHVGNFLDVDHNVITRTGLQCAPLVHEGIGTLDLDGTVRFSVGPLNTEEHIDRAIEAMRDTAEFARRRGRG